MPPGATAHAVDAGIARSPEPRKDGVMHARTIAAAALFGVSLAPTPARAQPNSDKEKAEVNPAAEQLSASEDARRESEAHVAALEARLEELEIELLQISAEAATHEEAQDDELELIEFQGTGRSLQMLNPELSMEADLIGAGIYSDGNWYSDAGRSGITLRELAFNLHSTLDPFSLARAAFALTEEGAELEEAYITYTSILPRLSLSAGRFRQQLGVVNRWHEHSLDQSHYPLMLTLPLGGEGLVQTGISLGWLAPSLWADALEVTLQITNGENREVFSGQLFSFPTTLLKVKNYWDLTTNTYFELGLSGAYGFNHQRGIDPDTGAVLAEALRSSAIAGFDLTLSWEPRKTAKYDGVIWRTEGLYVRKELPGDAIEEYWGAYSYLETKLRINLYGGVRGDFVRLPDDPIQSGRNAFEAVPYLTWWQSEFVRVRLEYDALAYRDAPIEHRGLVQLSFAAGPHKHERY